MAIPIPSTKEKLTKDEARDLEFKISKEFLEVIVLY